MFDSSDFPKSLDESTFDAWLEAGRQSRIGYHYLMIIWNEMEDAYHPIYVENRAQLKSYPHYHSSTSRESLIAAYDLYSESRVG